MKMILREEALEQKRELLELRAKELGVSLSWERPGQAVLVCGDDERRCDDILRSLLFMKTLDGPSLWDRLSELEAGLSH